MKFLAGKLGNKGFTERAPSHVVEEIRVKHEAAQSRRERLVEALEGLKTIVVCVEAFVGCEDHSCVCGSFCRM